MQTLHQMLRHDLIPQIMNYKDHYRKERKKKSLNQLGKNKFDAESVREIHKEIIKKQKNNFKITAKI